MMRRKSVWVLVSVCAVALVALGGCKKKDKAPEKAPDTSMAAGENDMTATPPVKPVGDQPKVADPAAPAGRAGALPVAFDQPLV